ncbi:TonB-dependent hemoglobin/transferrin/lactoferrin family receptor [Chroococcidiopsis sp. TS-821]|uniref:TonB-dependent hemoglobin/transferrin/lactoferrin family receptor n=1 Tax=Chroococcidiopsis sp. TS-821 TaxID=1378066 RepID=UPI000CEDD526|nr:TonB-dependent hemoglobin/transferrin/lactoferrin family receptor [Chroococcidiopsis sp. TS-821]
MSVSTAVAQSMQQDLPRIDELETHETSAQGLILEELEEPECDPDADSADCPEDFATQEDAEDTADIQITVTGTRTPRAVQDSPASITVIESSDIQRNLVQDWDDLVRYEPGVSVRNNLRYGLQDFNIRGIDGNRILIQVDGIRQPGRFEFGVFELGRDYFDLSTLQTVEIIKGPASALYGSDAIGGVVSFRTVEPADLLEFDRNSFTSVASNFNGENQGWGHAITSAARFGNLETLFSFTRRDSSERLVNGNNDFVDPRYTGRNNYLGKLVYRFNDNHALNFTGEVLDETTTTTTREVNLLPGIRSFVEDVDVNRTRLSLGYEFNNLDASFLQLARLQVYYQDAQTREIGEEERFLRDGTLVFRDTRNSFVDRSYGTSLQLQSNFATGNNINHRLTYGLELSTTRNERPRDRIQTNLITGETTRVIPPDVFPTKDFPDSDTLRFGVYLQDEIEIGETISLIPGIRYDYYSLVTDPDPIFIRGGAEAADLTTSAVSPSLGIVYRVTPEIALVGRYARGFRAPLYSEINSNFSNLLNPFFRYRTLSNPNLEPETSNSFEIGVRSSFPQASLSLTGFYNTYNNFIETFAPAGVEEIPGVGLVNLFQTQNVSEARIYGAEARGEYRFNRSPDGFSVIAALTYAVGDDLTANVPLSSVDPFKAVAGLRYRGLDDRWGAQLITTFVGRPRVEREIQQIPGSPPQVPFIPGSYTVFDLIGYYNFSPNFTLNLGVFNLFNQRYFQYADVRNIFVRPDIDRFAQPGRSIGVGVSWRF